MVLFPRPHQLGGQSGSASHPLERYHRTRKRRRHRRLAVRAARKLGSAAGSAGEICGERGASTHPFDPGTVFPLEARYSSDGQAKHSSGSSSSSSSSNDNTSDHDFWWDATCVGVLLRPFDPGKRCRRSARRGKAVLGVDLPFDRGKA